MTPKIVEKKANSSKPYISDKWLKEDNIGKKGFVLDYKKFKGTIKHD